MNERNPFDRGAASQKSGGEVGQPLSARKRTLTNSKTDRTAHKKFPGRSPITEHMSLLIERHMKDMMNKSLAVIKGFDKEGYLAPKRMKNGDGDPMMRHKFNQMTSDSTPCNRPLQDFRHPRYVGLHSGHQCCGLFICCHCLLGRGFYNMPHLWVSCSICCGILIHGWYIYAP